MSIELKNSPKFSIVFDEKRESYFVSGFGFKFSTCMATSNLDGKDVIECEDVKRDGSDLVMHLQIPLNGVKRISNDVFETLLIRQLRIYWP